MIRVYGVNLDGKRRGIVAAESQAKAAAILGITAHHVRTFGSPTGNPEEVKLAMSTPGVPWVRAYTMGAEWKQIANGP